MVPRQEVQMEERTRQLGDVTVHFRAPPGQTRRPEDVLLDPSTRFTREGAELTGNELRNFLQDQFRRNGYNIVQGAALDLGENIWLAVPRSGRGDSYVIRDANTRVTGIREERALSAYNSFVASIQALSEQPAGGTVVAAGEQSMQAKAAAVGMSVREYTDLQEQLNANPAFRGMSVEEYTKIMNRVEEVLLSVRESVRSAGSGLNLAGDPAVSAAITNLQNALLEAVKRSEAER